MSFGTFHRGYTSYPHVYSGGLDIIVGTRQPSYYTDLDQELTINPDGTISGGSINWAVLANDAYIATFGNGMAIAARDIATNFNSSAVVATGTASFDYGPYGGQVTFEFLTKYMNDESFWFDLDRDGNYETHAIDTGSGVALDLDFNGTYETPMIEFV